jgi:hypothetical protein
MGSCAPGGTPLDSLDALGVAGHQDDGVSRDLVDCDLAVATAQAQSFLSAEPTYRYA